MALPVVIATNGFGIPVTESENGIPVEIATNGYGQPVVVVDSGGFPVKGVGQVAHSWFDRPFAARSIWNVGLPGTPSFSPLNDGAYNAGTAYTIGDLAYTPSPGGSENYLYVKLTNGTGHALPSGPASNANWGWIAIGFLSWQSSISGVRRFSATTADPLCQVRFNAAADPAMSGAWSGLSDDQIWATGVAPMVTDYNTYSTSTADSSGDPPTAPASGTYHPKGAGVPLRLSPMNGVYIPTAAAVSDGNSDYTIIVRQPNGLVFEAFLGKKLSGNRFICASYKITDPSQYGDGIQNGFRASMIPGYAGVITAAEWDAALAAPEGSAEECIPHKIGLLVPKTMLTTTGVATYPGLAADSQADAGNAYTGKKVKCGDTLALPASFTSEPYWSTFFGSGATNKRFRIIERTLRTHGAVVIDRGGGGISVLTESDAASPLNTYSYSAERCLRYVLNYLEKVTISASEYERTPVAAG